MTDTSTKEGVFVRARRQASEMSSRAVSITAALLVDFGLIWFLFVRSDFNPETASEMFWLRVLIGFGVYAIVQQWTLANETGRGDTFVAASDKLFAISPLGIFLVIEFYWLGANLHMLSWRHHVVGVLFAAFAFTDYFATDITNQRLRARQFNVGGGDPDQQ